MSKKIKIVAISASLLLMMVVGYVFMRGKNSEEVEGAFPSEFVSRKLSFPDSINAGEELRSVLDFDANGCHLLVNTSWGNYILEPETKSNLLLPDSLTQTSGIYILDLACDGKVVASKKVKVISGEAAEPLEAFIGSKSIEADNGTHWAMILAIPADTFNNLTAEKTPVNFILHRPDESEARITKNTEFGVAYHKIYSKSKVGKTIIGVASGKATAKEKQLLEMPGFPVNFKIAAENVYAFADNRQNFHLKTSVIKDKYGNIVADGTLINIDVTDRNNSKRLLTTYTIDGIGELDIQNPTMQGEISINASIYGDAQSNTYKLSFKRYLKDLFLRFVSEEKVVLVGPLIGPLNQYMADGAEINMYVEELDSYRIGVVKNGYAKVDLTDLPAGGYKCFVSSGGIEKKIEIKITTDE